MRRWPQDRSVRNQRKIINPTCINCNAQGHMASSTECPLFPKPRKGKGQSQKENRKRNENNQENSAFITPGLSFSLKLLRAKILNRGQHEEVTPRCPTQIIHTKIRVLTRKLLIISIARAEISPSSRQYLK
ncbi:hypothetical protein TNCV_102621 [Trichonephila clavipes]|nr:hypothetical protein TNCV_102621 [Trichonephila clavipes]